jgi:ABC-type glycerol-3-phosphate transport system substrate-binding protein
VWLPPQFAPDETTPGGQVLAEQLAQFEQAHPDLKVEVRLKSLAGPGSLLASLSTAYNVAPAVLPDVVALNRDDLNAAASAGLVIPLDNFIAPGSLADYYPFAQTLSQPKGQLVGLPFAADARVLVYKTDVYPAPPQMWTAITTGTLVIPGGEPSGLTLLNEYLARGGPLADPSGKIVLDTELLTEALTDFQTAQKSGVLPLSTLAYSDTAATWQVFRERRATLAVTSAQNFLAENNRVTAAALVPTSSGVPFALADGWSWALVNTATPHPALAMELIQWLIAPAQLSTWTLAAHLLPARSAALDGWSDGSLAPFASDVLSHAQLPPPADVLALIGPPLQRALDEVLTGRATPFTAANSASQAVSTP